MSETRWTAGPWLPVHDKKGWYCLDAGGRFVAESNGHEQGTANALLIAAAPDLAEACRIARLHASLIKLAPERRHTIAVLDAALAKAKGETP